jgi:hypothetical protein
MTVSFHIPSNLSLPIYLSIIHPSIHLPIYLSVYLSMDLQPFVGPWPPVQFLDILIFYTVGETPRTGDQPVVRPLRAHRTAQTQNKRTQTSVPQVGFEPKSGQKQYLPQTARPLWSINSSLPTVLESNYISPALLVPKMKKCTQITKKSTVQSQLRIWYNGITVLTMNK